MSFLISFDKSPNYNRFVVTHVMTKISRGFAAIELCEETLPPPDKFVIDTNLQLETVENESNIINLIHATMIMHPEQLPQLIQALQNLYDNFVNNNQGGAGNENTSQ